MGESIPPAWHHEADKEQVILWLIRMPIDPRQKKWALYEWGQVNEVLITADDYQRVTGLPPGQI